jgi:DNA mismatch repair protein MutL
VLLVNGRAVRDRVLVGAVMRVLRGAGSGFGGARLLIDLRIPPDTVDVNVHPAKAEVRFSRSGAVFALVERALRDGISASQGRVTVSRLEEDPSETETVTDRVGKGYGEMARQRLSDGPPLFAHPVYDPESGADRSEGLDSTIARHHPTGGGPGAKPGPADTPFGRLIGQYLRRLSAGDVPSQGLLTPRLIEVGEAMTSALPAVEGLLRRVGIEAEAFGPDIIRVSAVPPELDPEAIDEVIEEALDRATALDGVPERAAEELSEELAASLSCRGAIKINHRLSVEEQRALLADLVTTDNPYRCPHGRPIILRLSQEEMERRLGRR